MSRSLPIYRLQVNSEAALDPQQALYLVNALVSLERVMLQIVARPQGIEWRVIPLGNGLGYLETLQNPKTSIQRTSLHLQQLYPFHRASVTYTTQARAMIPILYLTEVQAASDPLLPLAYNMSFLKTGEAIRYTVIVDQPHKPVFYQVVNAVDQVSDLWHDPYRYPRPFELVLQHKQQHPWYRCLVILEVDGPDPERVHHIRHSLNLHLNSCFDRTQPNHPFNGLRSHIYSQIVPIRNPARDVASQIIGLYECLPRQAEVAAWFDQHWLYLEAAEIATLWHLPHAAFADCNVLWQANQPALNYTLATNPSGVTLGHARYQDRWKTLQQLDQDRVTHTAIVGHTGTGKSTLMRNALAQDIAAGKGVIVIDPHGSLVSNLLQHSIPSERESDLVVLDLSQTEHPIPLNVFAGSQSYAGIGRIVDAIERLHSLSGVRMDRYLQAGIMALQGVPHATMKDLYYLLIDAPFRQQVLSQVEDEEAYQTLHEEYHQLTPQKQREIRAPIINRISPFFANAYLYPSLCHPQRLDFAEFIDQRRIVLISLGIHSEWVPIAQRNLVGALMISLIQLIGMNLRRDPQAVYVYIDEVQHFVTSSLDTLLSEARKYQVYLTIAHQFLDQLPAQTLQAVMGNVGTTVAFRSSPADAHALGPYLQPQFSIQDLVGLDRFHAAVKMQYKGATQPAFLLQIDRPPHVTPDTLAHEARLRQQSIKRYLPLTREEVLAGLNKRYPSLRHRKPAPPPSHDDVDYDQFIGQRE